MSNRWRNPELFAAIRSYCLEVFALWRRTYTTDEALPRRVFQRAQIEENNIRYPQEIHLDPMRLTLDRRIEDPSQVASLTTVERAMRADEHVARHLDTLVGTSGSSMRLTVDMCLRSILGGLLKDKDTLLFDEEQFEQIYSALEDYFYSDTITLRFMAPLMQFKIQVDRIDLEGHLSVRQLSLAEREQLLLQEMEFPGFGLRRPFPGPFPEWEKFALELILDAPKVFGEQTQPVDPATIPAAMASQGFQEVLLALRVFKNGQVGYWMIQQVSTGWNFGGVMSSFGLSGPLLGPPYSLSTEEIGTFTEFWREFRQARSRGRPRTDLALRRLSFGYERVRPEDKLIDYMIGLEGLLTRRSEGGDLTYRLALRGAKLLGNDPALRARIHAELIRAYRLRSEIVHGGEASQNVVIEQETIALGDFVERIAQYLRDAIKGFMRRAVTISESEVIKALDREAINGN